VLVSRIATFLLMALGALVALRYSTITGAWILTISLGAGAGIVYVLRWIWWRINAWSELSAMVASIAANAALHTFFPEIEFPYNIPIIVILSALVWVPVTFATAPVEEGKLRDFCGRVRPVGFWGRFRAEGHPNRLGRWLILWLVATAALYLFLFGGGMLIFGPRLAGVALFAGSLAALWYLFRSLDQEGWG
jgi:hypothetical protein